MGGRGSGGSRGGGGSKGGGGGGASSEPLLPTVKKIQPWDLRKMEKEELRSYSQGEYKNYHKYRDRLESGDEKFQKDGSMYKGTKLRMQRHSENYDKAYDEAGKRGYTAGDSNW